MKLERLTAQQIALYVEKAMGTDWRPILSEVVAGEAEAWRLNSGQAYMITRIEGKELVIVVLEGRGVRELAPQIIEQARRIGCRSIRYHTQRRGLPKLLESFGFSQVETVHRMPLWAACHDAETEASGDQPGA